MQQAAAAPSVANPVRVLHATMHGALDPTATRAEFLELARRAALPVLTVYGMQTPPRSRAEIEALIALPGMRSACLPQGKLGLHEEFPDAVAQVVEPFLAEGK